MNLNSDSQKLSKFLISSEGYLHLNLVAGIANQILNYDSRTEYCPREKLFDEKSIKTGIGKPIIKNHPKHEPINVNNYKKYAIGTTLQEYAIDGDQLILAGVIWDKEAVSKISSGEWSYVSAGYRAEKQVQQDGRYLQEFRDYNHFAFLTPEFFPRAGTESKILNLDGNEMDEQETPVPQVDAAEISQRVELWSQWKHLIEQNNKAIDFNLDSRGIKRLILSCHYPEKTLKQLNNDLLLDGFWLNFDAQVSHDIEPAESQDPFYTPRVNADSKTLSNRDRFILQMEGKK